MEYAEENEPTQQDNRNRWADMRTQVNRPLLVAVIVLVLFLGISAAYGLRQRGLVEDLAAQSATRNQSMAQLQNQVNTLTAQLQNMSQAQTAQSQAQGAQAQSSANAADETASPATVAEQPVAPAPAAKPAPAKKHSVRRSAAADKRYAQLQAQLADQQKQIKDTQDQMEKYRSDLEGNINTTRTELSGEIAKNHDELVLLEKKGERNYYEFEITKSKQFQRIGPVSISLRKTDTKHKSYDLSMLVDDNELNKKKVNLYEPVVIHNENDSQPMQIVVNHIDKNLVHGYVSAPKYRPSELTPAAVSSTSPAATPLQTSAHDSGARAQQLQ